MADPLPPQRPVPPAAPAAPAPVEQRPLFAQVADLAARMAKMEARSVELQRLVTEQGEALARLSRLVGGPSA